VSRKMMTLAGAGLVFVLAACGTSDKNNLGPASAAQEQEIGSGASGSDMMSMCPREMMDMMKNVTLTLNDTPTGISVDFVTAVPDKVEILRAAVRRMAEMHSGAGTTGGHDGMGSGTGGGMMGGHGGMGDHDSMMGGGGCGSMMTAMFDGATLAAEDIEGGARLTFTASSAEKIDALRAAVRSHFESMAAGKCPMM
jgi:hypothetical protein